MMKYSIVFLIFLYGLQCANLPCANNCATCSSGTQCLTCATQYYASSATGSLQCLSCGPFCLQCTSESACTKCMSPYVLQANGTCLACQISYASKCNTIVAASECQSSYYVSDNYCYNCLLNCAQCTSSSDCKTCISGYYLNSSVLTCNFCPSNCLSCDQYNSTRCTSCANGYTLSSAYTCDAVACSIPNCLYCQSTTTCKQCHPKYYWSSAQGTCVLGSSILCQSGAQGPFPNQCNTKCPGYAYLASANGTALWCLPYTNININSSTYYQQYLYAYNHADQFKLLSTTSRSLTLEASGQYSYSLAAGDAIAITTLPSYYRVSLSIKYRSTQVVGLELSATTEQSTQTQNSSLAAHSSTAAVSSISTVYLHSNNIKIVFNSSLNVVQILVRAKKCPSNCYRCLNQDLCEMCQDPQYVSSYKCVDNCTIYYHLVTNRTCLTTCPDSFYANNLGINQKFCQPCAAPCRKCISADKCLSCVAGKYLLAYSCVTVCPDGYYAGDSGLCQPCISPCKLCINQTVCLSCEQGFWDNVQHLCTSQCPAGYYGNQSTSRCQLCLSPCQTCRNTSARCITCLPGLYYFDYQCLPQCPQRYYPVPANSTCAACRSPCLACSSLSVCMTCSYNYLYNGSCIPVCPDGYFQNLGNKSCQACSSNCKTCEMLGQCTSCNHGACYLQGSCLSSCPTAKYYTSLLNPGSAGQECICQLCVYPCKQCLSSTQCSSCLQGYLLPTSASCVNTCPVGYFANMTAFECTNCSSKYNSSCLECTPSQCTRCTTGSLLHNGMCLASCPPQHYVSSQHCQKCVAPCFQCTSFTQCTSCISPYLYSNGSCIIQCPFGKVSYFNSTANMLICIACQSPCITCQNSQPTNCTMCAYGYFLYSANNTCTTNCSAIPTLNTYYNELVTSTCSKCMFPCKTCVSQTQCLSCQIGYLTSSAKCENCPYATYADSTGVCLACPSECSNCYSAQFCTGCNQGYYLYAYQCIYNTSICLQNGYYPIGRVCEPCQMPCLRCNATATKCTSCVSGYIFLNDACLAECPKGLFRIGSLCEACHSFCQTCSGTATYCFACKTGYLMILSKMQCSAACPSGTFVVGGSCQNCQYPCLECLSQAQCLSCISGTLVDQTCLSSCPSGYYSDSSMKCQPCQSPCSECQVSPTLCKQCIAGYYLFEDQCLGTCPSLYFGQPQAHQCLECLGLCNECASHVNCTTCDTGLAFYYNTKKDYGQCVGQCPMSFYKTTVSVSGSNSTRDECQMCLPQCLTCANNQQCVLCADNNVQYQGSCFAECPPQMYSYNGICQGCSAPCLNCTDTFTCTACMNDSFLLVGSAECIVGEVCPLGFYRIPNTRMCNGKCPAGYYHRNDRTCNSQGCDADQYKGADMFCYSYCPSGYISNKNYTCVKCEGDNCYKGLFYDVTPAIVKDQLILYLVFKEDPHYLVSKPNIKLTPNFNAKITVGLRTQRLLTIDTSNTIRDIAIELYPENSFGQLSLNLKFLQALASFSNPIQRPSKTVVLPGFDLYPSLPDVKIGFLLLICAVIGIIKNPFMTDFGQLIYLLALINLHYPVNLASALQSASIAHLHGFLHITQNYVGGKAKFSYITDLGLLSNCTINLLIIALGLVIFLIVFIIYQILKRVTNYNRVDQDPNENHQNAQQNNIKNQINEQIGNRRQVKAFLCLQTYFVDDFRMGFLNRLVYFNYLPLSVFTFGQLSVLEFSSESITDLIASILSIVTLISLLLYPIFIFKGNKPKYAFLMIRKLILGLALVLSVENSTYMIGVTAVISIMSGILVGAYGIQKWRVETRFNSMMEIAQAFLIILFAIFAMIGEGRSTFARLIISWVIIFFILIICLAYVIFSIFCLILWSCKRFRGIDYIEEWKNKHEPSINGSQNNSQSNQQVGKQRQTDDGNNLKTATVSKLVASLSKQPAKLTSNNEMKQRPRQRRQSNPTVANNQLFWTYNDHDEPQQDKNSQKAPELLIRCVNQFSDFDPKQNKHEE